MRRIEYKSMVRNSKPLVSYYICETEEEASFEFEQFNHEERKLAVNYVLGVKAHKKARGES